MFLLETRTELILYETFIKTQGRYYRTRTELILIKKKYYLVLPIYP